MTQPHAGPSADARTTHAALIEEARVRATDGCLTPDMRSMLTRLAAALDASERALRASEGPSWRCFHCDETFTDEAAARVHFGDNEYVDPACQIARREGGLLDALRRAEREIAEWRTRALKAEDMEGHGHAIEAELARYFKGARSAWEAFCFLDSTQGEVIALTEQLAQLRAEREAKTPEKGQPFAIRVSGYDPERSETLMGLAKWIESWLRDDPKALPGHMAAWRSYAEKLRGYAVAPEREAREKAGASLLADALRWRAMRARYVALDFAWGEPARQVAVFELPQGRFGWGEHGADAIADTAIEEAADATPTPEADHA